MSALSAEEQEAIREEWVREWQEPAENLAKYDVLFFEDVKDGYEGSAWGLVREKETGKLFEISGSHCSCMGYEGQWKPAASSVAYLTSEHFPQPYGMSSEAKARWADVLAALVAGEGK